MLRILARAAALIGLYFAGQQRPTWAFRFAAHAAALIGLYLAFSFALFLGLQVRPLYGNIGLGVVAVMAAFYVYVGFIRR